MPYRSWCDICTAAKAKEDAHRRGAGHEEDASGLPIFSMDYQSVDTDCQIVDFEDDAKVLKIIVGKDESTGNVMSHVVTCKGIGDEWVVRKIVRDMEEMGLGHAIVKTDGEPSIKAVQNRLQGLRPGRTTPRNPPAYNPQSNGPCEKAVQDVSAQLRTIVLALQARLHTEIRSNLPIVQWALEHATFILNKFNVGADGMTPYERQTGRKWRRPIVEFGEVVMAKLSLTKHARGAGKRGRHKRKLAARSIPGVWVGQMARTGEQIIIKKDGNAVKCRTIRRVPFEHRWSAERVLLTRATPRLPAPSSQRPDEIETKLVDEEKDRETADGRGGGGAAARARAEPAPADGPELAAGRADHTKPREFRIGDRILAKYGYTPGCPGCIHKSAGIPGHGPGHTTECRNRIRDRMDEDEYDKKVAEDATRRKNVTVQHEAAAEGAAPPTPMAVPPVTDPITEPNNEIVSDSEDDNAGGDSIIDVDDDIPELNEYTYQSDDDMGIGMETGASTPVAASPAPAEVRMENAENSESSDEDEGGEPPVGKKQKLQVIVPESDQIAKLKGEILECAMALKDACKHSTVQEIIKKLEKDKNLRIKPNKSDKGLKRGKFQSHGKYDMAEAYSPPRMTKMAKQEGLKDGWAFDLTREDPDDGTPWDLSIPEKQRKAERKVDEDKPLMLVLSPQCGPFSRLNELFNYPRANKDVVEQKIRDGLEHLKFAMQLCLRQHRQGRLFMFEHPVAATSWGAQVVEYIASLDGVVRVNFDFCMMGMETVDDQGQPAAARKRTGILTNSIVLATLLRGAQCRGEHAHTQLLGGRAAAAQVYPDKFCRLVCEAVRREKDTVEWQRRMQKKFDITGPMEQLLSVQKAEELATPPDEDPMAELYRDSEFIDDTTGIQLEKTKAIAARRLEIEYFKKMGVYSKVKREYWMRTITTRWLDTNKGDGLNPNYRARLVAREIKRDKRDDLFAATPPLESLRMVISICASHQFGTPEQNYLIMTTDVKRAYFYAPATRPIYIEIPAEDRTDEDVDCVGILNLSLYGTRDAAMNWSKT